MGIRAASILRSARTSPSTSRILSRRVGPKENLHFWILVRGGGGFGISTLSCVFSLYPGPPVADRRFEPPAAHSELGLVAVHFEH